MQTCARAHTHTRTYKTQKKHSQTHTITTHNHRCDTVRSDTRRYKASPPSSHLPWPRKKSQKQTTVTGELERPTGYAYAKHCTRKPQFRKPADAEQKSGCCNASRRNEELHPTDVRRRTAARTARVAPRTSCHVLQMIQMDVGKKQPANYLRKKRNINSMLCKQNRQQCIFTASERECS